MSGATVDAVVAALEAQPFGPVPFVWRDGAETTASGTITVVPGTAVRSQRPDCLPECRTRYRLAMACLPDVLLIEAHGTTSTADGRVVDAPWTGSIRATALDGILSWSTSTHPPTPAAELAGTLDLTAVGETREDARDLGLRVFLFGEEGTLAGVWMDVASTHGEGELTSSSASSLGSSPSRAIPPR